MSKFYGEKYRTLYKKFMEFFTNKLIQAAVTGEIWHPTHDEQSQILFASMEREEEYEGCQAFMDAWMDIDPDDLPEKNLLDAVFHTDEMIDRHHMTDLELEYERKIKAVEMNEELGLITQEEADNQIEDLMRRYNEQTEEEDDESGD